MPSKTETLTSAPASNDAFSELEQLRLIVFGQAKQELENKIEDLHSRLSSDIDMLQTQFNERHELLHKELNNKLDEQHKATLSAISDLSQLQESDKAELLAANESINSQLEMAENASKDDSTHIHKRIDEEVSLLETTLNNTTADILAQLEKVTKELSGSKTDRKKLALLLANVASNLDADD